MKASIPFHWWFMNNLAGQSVCLGPHSATQLHGQDELMNSELGGVKLGMTWWSLQVFHLVTKSKIDGFIRFWLSAAVTINYQGATSVTFALTFVCWHTIYSQVNVWISAASISSLTHAAQSLEKEVQEVKATLQTMLAQLKEDEEEEEEVSELQDVDLMKNGTEEEEEEDEEDQYFSDSWGIWNG